MTLSEFNASIESSTMIYVRPSNGHPFMEVSKDSAKEWARISVNNPFRNARVWKDREVWMLACENHVGEPLNP